MWRFSEKELNWVKMKTFSNRERRQFVSVTSTSRYFPPKLTAGLARSRVSG